MIARPIAPTQAHSAEADFSGDRDTVPPDLPPDLPFDLAEANARLEHASPAERLHFATSIFGEELLFTSSFGASSAVLLHLWSQVAPHLPVHFIDTGFLFEETLAYRDRLAERLGLDVRVVKPVLDRSAFVARYGEDIQRRDPDFCCVANKVDPIAGVLARSRAWVSGLRRDQSEARASTPVLERENRLLRVHPIVTLTRDDVAAYLARHDLPEHPLVRRRYLSIGCAPCTRAVAHDEDERAGRWSWSTKTECGLHRR